jgi:phage tail-like protein
MRPADNRFHMLLGEPDWGRCRMETKNAALPLADLWALDYGTRPVEPPDWDGDRGVITLPQVRDLIPVTAGEAPLTLADRRAAAADANGNIYWISDDRRQLLVRSAGSGQAGSFWPDPRGDRPAHDVFRPAAAAVTAQREYSALAVTDEGWLVAAFEEDGATGLSQFDLIGGGAPSDRLWRADRPIRALDLAAGCGGGLWLLDDRQRLFELDRTLGVVGLTTPQPAEDLFQPIGDGVRSHAPPRLPQGRDLAAIDPAIDAIAVEGLPGGAVALLVRGGDNGWVLVLPPGGGPPAAPMPVGFVPHDMALGLVTQRDSATALRLAVTGGSGNQAVAFRVEGEGAELRLHPTPEVFPLRRYGGRTLVAVRGALHYDSGERPSWVMLVERPRLRFAPAVTFVTPIFDGGTPQTVWDRLRADGCIPAGTALTVEARSADDSDPAAGPRGEWLAQPRPILNPTGSEFAGYGPAAIPATDAAHGKGSWELLLQRTRGRYLQLRITLSGDGRTSPHLRALRAWYPRQSWSERYLPAVYRGDPEPADFLERYLANMEGTVGVIERRIADAQALFDPRTAPVETLDWLASWFDVALDPAWDEARRRLFIAYAVRFFALRGTIRGMETALALAFDACVDQRLFTGDQAKRSGIRIVESFLTRRLTSLATAQGGGRYWTPAEGNAGLADRLARAGGEASATADQRAQPVPLFPPDGGDGEAWRLAMAAALGFVPEAGAAERRRWRQFQAGLGRQAPMADLPRREIAAPYRLDWADFIALPSRPRAMWQDFLRGRYRTIGALKRAHDANWIDFSEVSLPDHLPATLAGQEDWRLFEAEMLPTDAAAHRFSVLLPVTTVQTDAAALAEQAALARRIVELEKPAHTTFDIRFFFAMNRIGEARLGLDTTLGQGSRAPELLPPAILGTAYLGESFIGPDGPPDSDGRRRLAC